jgi:hypothetical protein
MRSVSIILMMATIQSSARTPITKSMAASAMTHGLAAVVLIASTAAQTLTP